MMKYLPRKLLSNLVLINLRKLLTLFVISISISSLFNIASAKVVNVDGEYIAFPSVTPLVDAQQELIDLLNQFQPPGNEIVIAYITRDDFDRFENYEEPKFPEFVQIMSSINNGEDASYSSFIDDIAESKRELIEIEESLTKVNAALLEQDSYISNLADVEFTNEVQAIIPFPILIDNKNTFAATILVANKQTLNGKIKRIGRIVTTIGIYINGRILNIAFYSNMIKNNNISIQEERVLNWITSFWEAN